MLIKEAEPYLSYLFGEKFKELVEDEDRTELVYAILGTMIVAAGVIAYLICQLVFGVIVRLYKEGQDYIVANRRMRKSTVERISKEEYETQATYLTTRVLQTHFNSREYQ